jgi:adenylate cyclase
MVLRRLAAIAVLDVVGYSRMMAVDEAGTHAALKAHRNELDPVFLNHGGRVVKGTGDGALIEIPSAVEAVRAAVEAQQLMDRRNDSLPDSRRMQMRIGINLGDVIVEDDGDIYGDGVNVAARLEALAEPGGICVSGSVYEQVAGRVDFIMEDLGEVSVKNIPRPVKAWRVRFDVTRPRAPSKPEGPKLPSVAVLPFTSFGEDSDVYFADGIVDDLITALSRYRDLRVVARSSSFVMRGRDIDVRDTARELDATYVVEGSIRRSGKRIRVSSQLIEAETAHHVWADRFDRELDDIFSVQDEIVSEITAHIHPNLERHEVARRLTATPEELDAWDATMRARHISQRNTPEAIADAISILEGALRRDPNSALLFANLAGAWTMVGFNRWSIDDRNPFQEMHHAAQRACELDPNEPLAVTMLAMSENYLGNWDAAEELARRAVSVAPHDAMALTALGQVRLFRGEWDGAVDALTESWRLAQHEPWRFHISTNLAFAHYLAERYDAAWAWAQQGLETAEYLQLRAIGAAALGQLGRVEEARRQLQPVIDTRPSVSADSFLRNVRWKQRTDIEHYRDGLVLAGLPG